MVEYLRECHGTIASLLAEADFDDAFPFVFGHPGVDNAEVQVRNELALLLRKVQMHLTAVIRANRSDNLHSVAVHARVILECAAQVQFKAHAAHEGLNALKRVLNAGEYDFRDAMLRMSRGSVDEDELQEMIIDAREGIGNHETTRPRRVTINDRIAYLSSGREWYAHLSNCFCGGQTGSLSGLSMFGGVMSSGTAADRLAIAVLLDYLAGQTILMLVSYGFLLIAANGDQQPFEDMLELSQRKSAETEAWHDTARQELR